MARWKWAADMPVSPEKRRALAERMSALGIREADLTESFVLGGGKGGQKVNKTHNCVCLIHEESGIVVRCSREREREINRFLARRALCDEWEHLFSGAPPAAAIERERARKRGKACSPGSLRIIVRRRKLSPPPSS